MDVKGVISIEKSSQSLGNKGICILVLNDDLTCKNIVGEMLRHCAYEVLHIGGVLDVLNAIWEIKYRLDLVLTNAHKMESNGIEIIQHIHKKFNLPIILMSPHKMKIVSKEQPCSFAAYVINGLTKYDVNNLWQFALKKETAKQEGDAQRVSSIMSQDEIDTKSFNEKGKRKREEEKNKKIEGGKDDPPTGKKRVVWTREMHQKFLEAIEIIGYERAVPKKIVEVMNVPGLSRENVASHLQKFRGSLKRTQEVALTCIFRNTTNELKRLPSNSTSRLKFSPKNSGFTTSDRNNYTDYGSLGFSTDQSGLDLVQNKYVPRLLVNCNSRAYDDQSKKKVQSTSIGSDYNQSTSGKFVGYTLTGDGKSIEFGKLDVSVNDIINRETLVSAPGHPGNDITDTCSTSLSLPHQGTSSQLMELPINNIPVQDFSLTPLETHGNDIHIQNSPAFFEDISQQHSSPSSSLPQLLQEFNVFLDDDGIDDVLLHGTSPQLDWEEFDNTLFNHDD